MKKSLLLPIILEILIIVVVFTFMLWPPTDPDLGWHLRYGQYFWQTGKILTRNIFSSSLPNYYWVNPSWGYEVILYPFFKTFGFVGLSIWGAATVTLAFIFITLAYKVKPWLKMFLLPPFLILSGVAWLGMRAQLDTILGLAIVYSLINKKRFIYLPFVFLIWANLHGGFILGLSIWFIFLAWRIILGFRDVKKQKELLTELSIFILSVLACFINPFTYRVFTEDFKNAISSQMQSHIAEWRPIPNGSPGQIIFFIYSAVLLIISAFILIKDWKKFLPHVLINTIFFFLTLGFRRYLLIYVLCSFPVALIFFKYIQGMVTVKWHKILNLLALSITFALLCYALLIRLPAVSLNTFNWNVYCLNLRCSEKLSDFLNENPPRGRGFNNYSMGSYLIWRVPQIKTFIDGRMTVWEENGINPFKDFVDIYNSNVWTQAFEKQNFSWAIAVPGTNLDMYLLSASSIWKLEYSDSKVDYYIKR